MYVHMRNKFCILYSTYATDALTHWLDVRGHLPALIRTGRISVPGPGFSSRWVTGRPSCWLLPLLRWGRSRLPITVCDSWRQRRYCTTKREMLDAVAMCIQFRSYLCGAKFTLHTVHKSLVWLHRFKDTEGMMARCLHALQQFQFSIVHRPGKDHCNADGLSRVPSSPCRQCTRPDCPPVVEVFRLHQPTFRLRVHR